MVYLPQDTALSSSLFNYMPHQIFYHTWHALNEYKTMH
jgi:hypothetical protein